VSQIQVTKREGVYIPIKKLEPELRDKIKEKLDFKFYDEKACKGCEWRPERHCDICDTCPAFKGQYKMATQLKLGPNENRYLRVPVGSFPVIEHMLENRGHEITIRDKSPKKRIAPIKFTGTYRTGQAEAVKAMIQKRRGVLKAPPRSGKTVSGTAVICKLSRKTLIIAGQREWLNGFIETFIGSKRQKKMTDIDPKRIKLCKTFEDFETHDICLCTPNTFYSDKGQKLLARIRDMFEVIFIDEVHMGAADKYIQILARLNSRWMIGLSGTPSRKDMKFVLVRQVVGPIIHEVIVESLSPEVRVNPTKYRGKTGRNARWNTMVSSIENDKGRIQQIARQAIKDVENGHLIMIPYSYHKAVELTIKAINELAGRRLAWPYHGQVPKKILDETLEKASFYKRKILVGTAKKLSVGLNIPRASMLYEVTMSSNKENAEQRMRRVCTPHEGKPRPCIRLFLDDHNVRRNCLRNEFFNVLKPIIKPIISEKTQTMLDAYFRAKTGQTGGKFEL